MFELNEDIGNLQISETIFKDVKFFVSGEIDNKIVNILKNGGAERMNYFSDYVTHLICGSDAEETDIIDANDLYEIPAVTSKWIFMCIKLNRLVSTKPYAYDNKKLFSNLVFCFSKISTDRNALWSIITYNGGTVQLNLNKSCTHLISTSTATPKFARAQSVGIEIVTPDWIIECIKTKMLVQTDIFHPKLIVIPKIVKHESTTAITGFEPDPFELEEKPETSASESTQALLDKLKQRMPWNQPSASAAVTAKADIVPPNVVAPSFTGPRLPITSTVQQNLQQAQQQRVLTQQLIQQQSQQQPFQSPMQTQPNLVTVSQIARSVVHHTAQGTMIDQPQPQLNQFAQPTQVQLIQNRLQQHQQQQQQQQRVNLLQQQQQQQINKPQHMVQFANQQMMQRGQMGQIAQMAQVSQVSQMAPGQLQQGQVQMQQQQQGQIAQMQQGQIGVTTSHLGQPQLAQMVGQNQAIIQRTQQMGQLGKTPVTIQQLQQQLVGRIGQPLNQQQQQQLGQALNQQQQQPQFVNISQQQQQQPLPNQQPLLNQQNQNPPYSNINQQQQLGQVLVQNQQQQQQQQHLSLQQNKLIQNQFMQQQTQVGQNQQPQDFMGPQQLSQQQQQPPPQQQHQFSQSQQFVSTAQAPPPFNQPNQQQMVQNQQFVVQNRQSNQFTLAQALSGVPPQQQQLINQQQIINVSQQGQQQQIVGQQLINPNQQLISAGQQLINLPQQQQQPQPQSQQQPQPQQQMTNPPPQQQLINQQQQLINPVQVGGQQQLINQQQHLGAQQMISQAPNVPQQIIAQQQQPINKPLLMGQQPQPGQQVLQPNQPKPLWQQQQQPQQQQPQQQPQQQQQLSIRHPTATIIQQQPGQRIQWSPNQQQPGVPQRQYIHLDAQTHQQLQQMAPEQRALFIAKIQKQRQMFLQRQQLQMQQQQRGGHVLIRSGPVPQGLNPQQQMQWLQQQAKQQGIMLQQQPNIQQQQQQQPVQAQQNLQHAPGLSPIQQQNAPPQFNEQNQLQLQRQQQFRLQQMQLQREQAQKAAAAAAASAPQPPLPQTNVIRPIGQPQTTEANVTTVVDSNVAQQQLVVNAKTKTALANMLSIRLQSGGSTMVPTPDTITEPSAAGTLRLMTAQHNAALNSNNRPQDLLALQQQQQQQQQRRPISGPNGELIRPAPAPSAPPPAQPEPPKLQYSPRNNVPVQHRQGPFYGHNPNLKLPPDLFLLGCIFVVVELDRFLEESLPTWQQQIEKHGGELEKQYCSRVTHVLCETQRHGVVMQALRDYKRCVTLYWLSDVMKRKQVLPPWTALHLPTMYLDTTPASKHLVSLTGFVNSERNRIKHMIKYIGATFTSYFSKHNTLLIAAKTEGTKYMHAKKWGTPVVNVQWLTDVMLGNFSAVNQMEHIKYQQYPNPAIFTFEPSLVPSLMHAWKMPINISQESYERVKRSASPVVLPKKVKKQKTEHVNDENESPNDQTPPSATHRILFSMFADTKDLEKIVKDLGGSIAKDHSDCTHLIMPYLARTNKLLYCICLGIHVLPESWIRDSGAANKFLDHSSYSLDTKEFNSEYKCDFNQTLATRNRNKLFEGKFFYITPSVYPSKRVLTELIRSCSGIVEKNRRTISQIEATNINSPYSYIILTHANDLHLVYDVLRNKKDKIRTVCNVELIYSAILKQTFEVEPYAVQVCEIRR